MKLPEIAEDGPYEMVEIEWRDAWQEFDMEDNQPEHDDYILRTMGYLIGKGEHFISIAQEILPYNNGFRGVSHMPIDGILSVTTLFYEGGRA